MSLVNLVIELMIVMLGLLLYDILKGMYLKNKNKVHLEFKMDKPINRE